MGILSERQKVSQEKCSEINVERELEGARERDLGLQHGGAKGSTIIQHEPGV